MGSMTLSLNFKTLSPKKKVKKDVMSKRRKNGTSLVPGKFIPKIYA